MSWCQPRTLFNTTSTNKPGRLVTAGTFCGRLYGTKSRYFKLDVIFVATKFSILRQNMIHNIIISSYLIPFFLLYLLISYDMLYFLTFYVLILYVFVTYGLCLSLWWWLPFTVCDHWKAWSNRLSRNQPFLLTGDGTYMTFNFFKMYIELDSKVLTFWTAADRLISPQLLTESHGLQCFSRLGTAAFLVKRTQNWFVS